MNLLKLTFNYPLRIKEIVMKKKFTLSITAENLEILKEYCKQYNRTEAEVLQECLRSLPQYLPLQEIALLRQELEKLKREKADLEILLESTAAHSDTIEEGLEEEAEELKKESEERLRCIAEATPVSVVLSRISDGQILYANSTASSTFGLPLSELLSRRTLEFYHDPSDREKLLAIFRRDGYVQGYEVRAKKANGTPFWMTASIRLLRFKQEVALLSALWDITTRKEAEAALSIAEENYRSIFENALEGIFQSSPEGEYIRVNPAMARIYGYESPLDMMEKVGKIGVPAYVDPQCGDLFQRLIEQEDRVKDFQYQVYRRDGVKIWLEENTRAVRDSSGKLLYYEGILQDITNRKQEEEALKRQVQKLKIEIDQQKRQQEVASIIQSDYFQELQEQAEELGFK